MLFVSTHKGDVHQFSGGLKSRGGGIPPPTHTTHHFWGARTCWTRQQLCLSEKCLQRGYYADDDDGHDDDDDDEEEEEDEDDDFFWKSYLEVVRWRSNS